MGRFARIALLCVAVVSAVAQSEAVNNMRSLGISSRTLFFEHDLTKPLPSDLQYDLALSNLVFHNIGKRRFKAYQIIFDSLKPRGYFVIGDLLGHGNADMDYFSERAKLVKQVDESSVGPWDYKINVLRKR
jgi:SAM-dependent methyltransferase